MELVCVGALNLKSLVPETSSTNRHRAAVVQVVKDFFAQK